MDKIEAKLLDCLTDNEIFHATEILMVCGTGTVLPQGYDHHRLIAMGLADALVDPKNTEWETEIGKFVLSRDKKTLQELARNTFRAHPQCPNCGYISRLRRRARTNDYKCSHCKYVVCI